MKIVKLLVVLLSICLIGCKKTNKISNSSYLYPDSDSVVIDTLKVLEGRKGEGSFVFLKDNKLAYVYTSFIDEVHDYSSSDIYYIVSSDPERKKWSEPKLLVKNHGKKNIMSVSCLKKGDTILLQYIEKNTKYSELKVVHRHSYDDFKTLTPIKYINTTKGYGVVNNDRIIEYKNDILIPISMHEPKTGHEKEMSFNLEGKIEVAAINKEGATNVISVDTPVKYIAQEPGLVKLSNDKLMLFLRSDSEKLLTSFSNDVNLGFSRFEENDNIITILFSPVSIKNIDSDLIIVYNKRSNWFSWNSPVRSPLVLAVSTDDLQSIHKEYILEEKKVDTMYAYTAIIKDGNNLILGYYGWTIKPEVKFKGKIISVKNFFKVKNTK